MHRTVLDSKRTQHAPIDSTNIDPPHHARGERPRPAALREKGQQPLVRKLAEGDIVAVVVDDVDHTLLLEVPVLGDGAPAEWVDPGLRTGVQVEVVVVLAVALPRADVVRACVAAVPQGPAAQACACA